jgi:hypothetical protein
MSPKMKRRRRNDDDYDEDVGDNENCGGGGEEVVVITKTAVTKNILLHTCSHQECDAKGFKPYHYKHANTEAQNIILFIKLYFSGELKTYISQT